MLNPCCVIFIMVYSWNECVASYKVTAVVRDVNKVDVLLSSCCLEVKMGSMTIMCLRPTRLYVRVSVLQHVLRDRAG